MSAHPLPSLLPKPAHAEVRPGELLLHAPVGLWADPGASAVAGLVQAELSRATGLAVAPAGSDEAQIVLRLDDD
ncbi:MAG: hypothetical protein KDE24_25745, partial [Caldilinea sp.]|nr:hypothetical protein [Caldilinea sp.]